MVRMQQILEFAQDVARRFPVERVILFGSYAYGRPTPDSDVDLLVIMPHHADSIEKAVEIRRSIHAPFALDLLVRSAKVVRQRLAWNDFFLREIVEKGRVLYDASHAGVGARSRSGSPQRAKRVSRA